MDEDLTLLSTTESVLDYHSRKISYAFDLLENFDTVEEQLNESKSVLYLSPQFMKFV